MRVQFSRQAAKDLRRTILRAWPPKAKTVLWDEAIPANRHPRVGAWRTIYRVNEAAGILDIAAIRPRSGPYRK